MLLAEYELVLQGLFTRAGLCKVAPLICLMSLEIASMVCGIPAVGLQERLIELGRILLQNVA